jgi:hypothetical protein
MKKNPEGQNKEKMLDINLLNDAMGVLLNDPMEMIKRYQAPGKQLPLNMYLEYDQMGQVIFYYHYAHNAEDETYIEKANDLLEQMLDRSRENSLDHFYKLGCSILYLLRNHFVNGNEDDIASEADHLAFMDICYYSDQNKIDWRSLIHYLKLRITGDTATKNQLTLLKNKQLVSQLLDVIQRESLTSLLSDDRIREDLNEIRETRFCQVAINKLADNLSCQEMLLEKINDLSVTFAIPVRIDSPERKRNLSLLLEYLKQFFDSSFMILEADVERKFEYDANDHSIRYCFIKDDDPVFHRTKYINTLLSMAETSIVGIWDTDVIIPAEQISQSIREIQQGSMMSFPYDGRFYTLSAEISQQYAIDKSTLLFLENISNLHLGFGAYTFGGAFFVNKYAYLSIGGENESFYGWGVEDLERVRRVEIAGFSISRVEGPLFHLFHRRKSWFANEMAEMQNRSEFIKICGMTKDELNYYVKTWKTTTRNS